VSVNTVADSMRRQGLAGRNPKRRRGLTRRDGMAAKFPDLLRRDFIAAVPNQKWCGDITEIPPMRTSCICPRCWIYAGGVAGVPDVGSPGRRGDRRCDQDGRHGAWRKERDRRRDLPHRSWTNLHCKRFHRIKSVT
jgi:hypothetical protein